MVSKRLVIAALILIPFTVGLYRAYAPPPQGPMGVNVPPGEDVYVAQIANSAIRTVNVSREEAIAANGPTYYRRDAHTKTIGCVSASFRVNPLQPDHRIGLFATPNKEYRAWIRFSSGSSYLQSDSKPDAHGMAVKVLGVEGRKLLEGEENEHTQDFLMINNPVFCIRDVPDYAELTKYQSAGSAPKNQFAFFFDGYSKNPLRWRLRELRLGIDILKMPPSSVLDPQYHSMTAYRYGPQRFVKYSLKRVPCGGSGNELPGSSRFNFSGDRLTTTLRQQVKDGGPYCFDLMVQFQDPTKNMPVEDTTVLWSEDDSPFLPVARLTIPRQDIAAKQPAGFCENLAFTPWHALPQHEPVGGLNRIRKAVYVNVSRYRRCMNGVAVGEPSPDGSAVIPTGACSPNQPIPENGIASVKALH
jgi:catalase